MKTTFGILIAALLVLACAHETEEGLNAQFSIRCFHTIDWRFYDLKPLMPKE